MSSYSEVSVVKRFEATIIICPIAKNEPWLYQILSHFYINQFETVCHTRITFGSYWKAAMTDDVGDGICYQSGEGPYELYMDDELMIYGSDFNYGKKVSQYHRGISDEIQPVESARDPIPQRAQLAEEEVSRAVRRDVCSAQVRSEPGPTCQKMDKQFARGL